MKKNSNRFKIFLLLFAFLLTACGKIKIKKHDDIPKELGGNSAEMLTTNDDINRVLDKGSVNVDIYSYATQQVRNSGLSYEFNISPPIRDGVALTAIAMDGTSTEAFIVYRSETKTVIDILDITNKRNITIKKSYDSTILITDIKIIGSHLFILGNIPNTTDRSALFLFDLIDREDPKNTYTKQFQAQSLNLDLATNLLHVSTKAGITMLNTADIDNVTVTESINRTIFYGSLSLIYKIALSSVNGESVLDVFTDNWDVPRSVNSVTEDKSRFIRQNDLVYLNGGNNIFSILDISQTLKNKPIESVFQLNLFGQSQAIAFNQQKSYLAQGSEGLLIVNSATPATSELKGKLLFYDGAQSTDNAWTLERTTFKYLFINDNIRGLRILSESLSYTASNEILLYARGENNNGNPAKLLVRLNGSDLQTVTLSNTAPQLFTVVAPQTLLPNDQVQVILLNPNNTQSGFVSFVNINGRYCYQKYRQNVDNTGLFNHLQTIVASELTCDGGVTSPLCVSGSDKIPNESCSLSSNRVGKLVCDENGLGYNCEETGSCDTGYFAQNGSCIPQVCQSNQIDDCSDQVSVREKTCNASGTVYGSCNLVSCKSGNYLSNGQCIAQLCSPNSTAACSVTNGSGTKTCNSEGSDYGACTTSSCNAGYALVNGLCVQQTCTPNAVESCETDTHFVGSKTCASNGVGFSICQADPTPTCANGYYLSGGQCLPQSCTPSSTTSCLADNGTGTKTCNIQGSGYGSCSPSSCDAGYVLVSGQCVVQTCSPNSTGSCSVANGSGTRSCNAQGTDYGSCTPNSCDAGYTLINGSCIEQTCSPNSVASCSVTNGSGTKTCNAQGTAYGSCDANSCSAGYSLIGGQCVIQSCTPNSVASCTTIDHFNGSMTCSNDGLSYGSCVSDGSCKSGYYNNNGTCEIQLCSPNSAASCSISNGAGSMTCNSLGSAYGTCLLTSCNAGYYQNGNTCVIQDCSPNSTSSCSVTNGSGTQTCNAQGSGYGSCSINSCNSNYHLEGGQCVDNIKMCAVSNGSGTQAWNGTAYGTCNAFECNSGYHVESESGALICKTNTKSCSISNGAGSQTWNGTSYGSCTVTSCNSGFYSAETSCEAQLCSPNSTASCAITNGTGSKTCDDLGSAYGSCALVSCGTGFHNESGSCVSDTMSCSLANGSGVRTWNGSSYGACAANSCNAGYHVESGSCMLDTKSCSITNGTGTHTWNGSAYGTCTVSSCNSGFYQSGNTCAAQTCTHNTTARCSVSNGSGIKTCAANGAAYASCLANSCNTGYHIENGLCQTNTRSCSITNGTGSQTWNSTTQDYGTCMVTSCSADAYQSGNSCVLY